MQSVCLFAGSSYGIDAAYGAAAADLAHVLAGAGIRVVYGGAKVGLMGVLADAALAAGGEVVGVIPEPLVAREIAHTGLTALHTVGSMHERKALMAELSDAFIALPGGWGTFEELFEVMTWAQLGLHRKPCGLLNVSGYYDGLLAVLGTTVAQGFVRPEYLQMVAVDTSPVGLLAKLNDARPPAVTKWIEPDSV